MPPKQPGKKVCALLSAFGFRVLCGLRLGAVRGTFNLFVACDTLFRRPAREKCNILSGLVEVLMDKVRGRGR